MEYAYIKTETGNIIRVAENEKHNYAGSEFTIATKFDFIRQIVVAGSEVDWSILTDITANDVAFVTAEVNAATPASSDEAVNEPVADEPTAATPVADAPVGETPNVDGDPTPSESTPNDAPAETPAADAPADGEKVEDTTSNA